jgi:hypothetical protein
VNDAVALLLIAFLAPGHDEGMRAALPARRERTVVDIESVGDIQQAVFGKEGGERVGAENLVRGEAEDAARVLVRKIGGSGQPSSLPAPKGDAHLADLRHGEAAILELIEGEEASVRLYGAGEVDGLQKERAKLALQPHFPIRPTHLVLASRQLALATGQNVVAVISLDVAEPLRLNSPIVALLTLTESRRRRETTERRNGSGGASRARRESRAAGK